MRALSRLGRGTLLALGMSLAVVTRSGVAAADGPAIAKEDLPPSEPSVRHDRWYGWQPMLVDAAASAFFVVSAATSREGGPGPFVIPGLVAYIGGGPIVHGFHGRAATAVGDLAMRLGLPLVIGAAAGASHQCSSAAAPASSEPCDWLPEAPQGVLMGMAIAAVADAFILSCVLRLPAVYGRRDYRRRFGAIVDALDAGEDLPCVDGARFRWTHADVRDVAHAIVVAAENVKTGFSVYNVGEAETPTMRARVDEIARVAGRTPRWRETSGSLPDAFMVLGSTPGNLVVRSTRLRDELWFTEVTDAEERLRDLVAWCRETRQRDGAV